MASVPLMYLASPSAPVWARSQDYLDEDGPVAAVLSDDESDPPFFMVTSQTCDVVESAGEAPNHAWVQAAPVFNMDKTLNSGEKKMLKKRGWRRWYWHLPALADGFWVADLRIEVPIEKGLLASLAVIPGHLEEPDRRALGHRLAVRRERPAFSDDFCAVVQAPLVTMLRNLKKDDQTLYEQMDPGIEVLVRMDDHLNPTRAQVVLLCDKPPTTEVTSWWNSWWDVAHSKADAISLNLLPVTFTSPSEMTVAEYRQLVRMPLDRVSPD